MEDDTTEELKKNAPSDDTFDHFPGAFERARGNGKFQPEQNSSKEARKKRYECTVYIKDSNI